MQGLLLYIPNLLLCYHISMQTYVALLRGINVGGNKKVEMAKLRSCFETLGYKNVSTYINSGNVIFDTNTIDLPTLTQTIDAHLKKTFGFTIDVVIRNGTEIKQMCKKVPTEWTNNILEKTDVLFLWKDFDSKKSLTLIEKNPDVDTLLYVSGAIVWHIARSDYSKSGMRKFVGTPLYKHMTARNVNTLRALALRV